MNEIIKTILTRASIRNYTDEEIPRKDLELIVKAGMAAPSAMNIQPWRIVVVTEREILDSLADKLAYAKMLRKAGAAIVVCGEIGLNIIAKKYWDQDCSALSQNILLAVHSLGYGAVWTGVYPDKNKEKGVREVLGIPDKIHALNVIAIGVPKRKAKVKDKFDKKKLHWEKW